MGFRSTNTIEKYIRYLEETYILFLLNRFSFKVKEQIKTQKKRYLVDNGFSHAKSSRFSKDTGKLMENVVFVELLRKGIVANRDLYYYKTKNGYEVDFVVKNGIEVERLIQVSYDVDIPYVKERELRGLIKASKELNCCNLVVITWDYEGVEDFKGNKVEFISLWKWFIGS